ncbi:MAG: hypothetical protein QOH67_4954 [Hyphomicrobiales bacterium]|nr:hypothetical protein [Hyphomicrobiales bacterium]
MPAAEEASHSADPLMHYLLSLKTKDEADKRLERSRVVNLRLNLLLGAVIGGFILGSQSLHRTDDVTRWTITACLILWFLEFAYWGLLRAERKIAAKLLFKLETSVYDEHQPSRSYRTHAFQSVLLGFLSLGAAILRIIEKFTALILGRW